MQIGFEGEQDSPAHDYFVDVVEAVEDAHYGEEVAVEFVGYAARFLRGDDAGFVCGEDIIALVGC
jgi:hypothetical protein